MVQATPVTQYAGSLTGYIDFAYAELVAALGEPNSQGDGYKTDAEWHVTMDDGTEAFIYNYKDGVNYNGEDGTPVAVIRDWHVGSAIGWEPELASRLTREIHAALNGKSA